MELNWQRVYGKGDRTPQTASERRGGASWHAERRSRRTRGRLGAVAEIVDEAPLAGITGANH